MNEKIEETGKEPTTFAEICKALKKKGFQQLDPNDPTLVYIKLNQERSTIKFKPPIAYPLKQGDKEDIAKLLRIPTKFYIAFVSCFKSQEEYEEKIVEYEKTNLSDRYI